jgi:hypothetical protein
MMLGVIILVLGFIIMNTGGAMLCLPSKMKGANGMTADSNQTKYAIVAVLGVVMCIVGQYMAASGYSY